MTMLPVPRIIEDDGADLDETAGFDAFAWSKPLDTSTSAGWQRGWWRGWARCYGQGVKASITAGEGRATLAEEAVSPYPQFSGPWEAWAEGHDCEVYL